jgi:hypothetical protein
LPENKVDGTLDILPHASHAANIYVRAGGKSGPEVARATRRMLAQMRSFSMSSRGRASDAVTP